MKPYYLYEKEELLQHTLMPLQYFADNEAIFEAMADEMIAIIQRNNERQEATVIICPVGPVGQYPFFVKKVNEQQVNLRNTWFINMDEYLTDDKEWIDIEHRLSFRGFMKRNVYDLIESHLVMPENQRIFPNPQQLDEIPRIIAQLGKVDACFGGIGINGHVAFNEPDTSLAAKDFYALPTRVLEIDPMTQAINAVGDLNGAIEEMPRYCVTIGMREILQAQQIRLGVFRDWHRAVLRRAACGEVTTSFPVTLLRQHQDIRLYFSEHVATINW
ncbi:glucosamine-6-phosphate isomerase [Aerococcaceae bacterium NML201209]|nr:glucosamine-6-phosphate isomerase [Aerococcaceae bacterium NML201209]